MRSIVILAAAAGMFTSAALADPATTQSPASAQQPVAQQTQTAAADSDPIECYYQFHEGMVIRQKACEHRSFWTRSRLEQQRMLSDIERGSLRNNIR